MPAPSYIRPTQGLPLRKSGGTMQVNLENIGGRILVMEEIQTHRNRMRDVKPAVNVTPPWGHQQKVRKRAATQQRIAAPPFPGGSTTPPAGSRPQSARAGRPGTGTMTSGPAGPPGAQVGGTEYTDVSTILPSDESQGTYQQFVDLLTTLTTEQSRMVLEAAYRESEERKLLAGYTGVFPGLIDSDEEGASPSPAADEEGGLVDREEEGADGQIASPGAVGSPSHARTSETSGE
eukprot:Hpha_TRINITY_DN14453_c0_g1::TRINITY_DN14453_c0_g1_i1::g.157793::m.157793